MINDAKGRGKHGGWWHIGRGKHDGKQHIRRKPKLMGESQCPTAHRGKAWWPTTGRKIDRTRGAGGWGGGGQGNQEAGMKNKIGQWGGHRRIISNDKVLSVKI